VGLPMILMGDEVRRTQSGNNNAYCQDDEISWFDWALVTKHADLLRFVKLLIARRLLRDMEAELQRLGLDQLLREAKLTWHGVRLGQPDWSDYSHSLALGVEVRRQKLRFHIILSAYWEPLDFDLPPVDSGDRDPWRRWIDTALDSPLDIVEWQKAPPVTGRTYRAGPRSVVVLLASLRDGGSVIGTPTASKV
jgi:isoamylase